MKNLCKIGGLSLALLGMMGVMLLTVNAAASEQIEWTTDTLGDFAQGMMDGVDVWSDPGTARLDRRWRPSVQVNDSEEQGRVYPSLTFFLSNTAGLTETVFAAVWEDERNCDHCPDIYFSRSTDGGQSWSANGMVQDPCDPNDPPYPDCVCLFTPDITVRRADNSLWVVWQQDPSYDNIGPDDGDIYYAVSSDQGQTWSASAVIYDGAGLQIHPRIASAQSGYLYVVWEDERDDDGDIYISRFNPAVDTAWSTPIKISDDTTGAEQREPDLTVDAQGNVYVAWEDTRENVYGEVYFTRWLQGSAWDAGAWSANTRLSDAGMDWGDQPDLAVAGDNTLLAAWRERVGTSYSSSTPNGQGAGPLAPLDPTYDWQIVVARSSDQGQTWSRTVVSRLYDASATLADYSDPVLSVGPQGRVYAAWVHCLDPTSNTANVLFASSPDGGVHWTLPQTISFPPETVDASTHPALAADLGGKIVAAWGGYQDSRPEIYATGYPTDQYLPGGEYRRELDAGGTASWGTIEWALNSPLEADTPTGTGLMLATRTRIDETAAWTEWYTHTTSGEAIPHPDGRYLQYRVLFASDGSTTPQLNRVTITYERFHQIFLPLVIKKSSGQEDFYRHPQYHQEAPDIFFPTGAVIGGSW